MPGLHSPKPQRYSPSDEPRITRTRDALEAGLWELLRDHELAEISVAALCRQAGVHRTTFYGHHRNIFDFAGSVYAGVVDRLGTVELDQRGTGRTIAEIGDLYVESIRQIVQHTKAEQRVYRALFHTETFLGILADQLNVRILLALHVWRAHNVPPPALDLDATAAFLGGAYASWFEQWVVSDDDDVEARLATLRYLLPCWWPRDGFPEA
ncbi:MULTISPECIES: TetR/AcrR family transcriptional regulator [Arthrobacter]|uniref:TetR/AcrR family transcriptional regulator n=1 Tax=Arthrobacter jinronghuae TaxID=2964609 RepID=A0ABT1NLN2_9MICC|nr:MULTISPECIES: TetR/AcrR family transcriptional regulator [Arthrobacter]MCQ1948636.1 TetR/AcrR family transcriptional regulator [Arthrobacter jinronghuae]MCQ1951962.1 TetR/AcrR family transcriptional regulator [Arthrobacter sp. zg-Y238]MCQ1955902.1 TetR/AcrR family transcriptional regulator [Arthrobacter jinronghuae]UWX78549.1 TetR/AcrR family transcriptional regulator [Arthrobacter jinronghuae]